MLLPVRQTEPNSASAQLPSLMRSPTPNSTSVVTAATATETARMRHGYRQAVRPTAW